MIEIIVAVIATIIEAIAVPLVGLGVACVFALIIWALLDPKVGAE